MVVRRKVNEITVHFKRKGAASPLWAMEMVTRNRTLRGKVDERMTWVTLTMASEKESRMNGLGGKGCQPVAWILVRRCGSGYTAMVTTLRL